MDEHQEPQPVRERTGSRAWGRTIGLVGGGLLAGGILAGTMTANAATGDTGTSVPSVTQEQGTTTGVADEGTSTDGAAAPEDCPADASTSSDADAAA